MHTSSFWRFYHRRDPRLVSIAVKTPEWFQGRRYPALAPRLDMLAMEEDDYRREYQAILDRLDPRQVYEDLGPEAIHKLRVEAVHGERRIVHGTRRCGRAPTTRQRSFDRRAPASHHSPNMALWTSRMKAKAYWV